jgi:transcriptional regulator with XRE-family HTH domain
MDEHQKAARDLINRMLAATGLDLTGLARKAGVSPSTLTRFMNSPVKHTVSAKTLQKLSGATGVRITMGGDLDDPRLTRLVASYFSMSETAKQALDRIALELASAGPGNTPSTPRRNRQPEPKVRAPPKPPFPIGGHVKENRVSRPLLTVVQQRACPVVDGER